MSRRGNLNAGRRLPRFWGISHPKHDDREPLNQQSDPTITFTRPKGEDTHPSLLKAAKEGVFDGGAIDVRTMEVGDLGPWAEPGVPIAENPPAYGYQGATVRMPVEDFHRLQTYIGSSEGIAKGLGGNPPPGPEQFWTTNPERVDSIAAVLRGDEPPKEIFDGVPMPYVEIGSDGTLRATQEGRHRTVAAEQAGLETIPVRIVYNSEREGEGGASGFEAQIETAVDSAAPQRGTPTVDRFVSDLEFLGAEITSTTEIGNDVLVNFHLPGVTDNQLQSGIQFTAPRGVAEATIRLPELQEASQATRGIINRFPELVRNSDPPGDRLESFGFDYGDASSRGVSSPARGERLVFSRLGDPRARRTIRPHVQLKAGHPRAFDANNVTEFVDRLLENYEAEFKPYRPRDDIELRSEIESAIADRIGR